MRRYEILSLVLVSMTSIFACNGTSIEDFPGKILGRDEITSPPAPIPTSLPQPTDTPLPDKQPAYPAIGKSCHTTDSNKYCLSLKYVTYKDSKDKPVVSDADVLSNLEEINQIWSQCDIAFQIDKYNVVDPRSYSLQFSPADYYELTDIREVFSDSETLLVVTTGPWDRSGSLGNTGANAWTAMPGSNPLGAILESPVGTYENIIAHELGHYLNLDHVNDSADLMSPIVYTSSKGLSASQCEMARSALQAFWRAMLK